MIKYKEQKILPYSQEQLFNLVADIERYPEFLPWCQNAKIHEKKESFLTAELIIGYKLFKESYISNVHLTPSSQITVSYAKGPLKHLSNLWYFMPIEIKKCQVNFEVEFELRSLFLQKAVEAMFSTIIEQMLGSFEDRARTLYA